MLNVCRNVNTCTCLQNPETQRMYYTIHSSPHYVMLSEFTSLPPEHQRANDHSASPQSRDTKLLASHNPGTQGCLASHNPGTHGCRLPHHPNNQGTRLFGYSPPQHPGTHSCLVSPPHTTEVTRREPYVEKMLSSKVLVGVQWVTNKQESLKLMNP